MVNSEAAHKLEKLKDARVRLSHNVNLLRSYASHFSVYDVDKIALITMKINDANGVLQRFIETHSLSRRTLLRLQIGAADQHADIPLGNDQFDDSSTFPNAIRAQSKAHEAPRGLNIHALRYIWRLFNDCQIPASEGYADVPAEDDNVDLQSAFRDATQPQSRAHETARSQDARPDSNDEVNVGPGPSTNKSRDIVKPATSKTYPLIVRSSTVGVLPSDSEDEVVSPSVTNPERAREPVDARAAESRDEVPSEDGNRNLQPSSESTPVSAEFPTDFSPEDDHSDIPCAPGNSSPARSGARRVRERAQSASKAVVQTQPKVRPFRQRAQSASKVHKVLIQTLSGARRPRKRTQSSSESLVQAQLRSIRLRKRAQSAYEDFGQAPSAVRQLPKRFALRVDDFDTKAAPEGGKILDDIVLHWQQDDELRYPSRLNISISDLPPISPATIIPLASLNENARKALRKNIWKTFKIHSARRQQAEPGTENDRSLGSKLVLEGFKIVRKGARRINAPTRVSYKALETVWRYLVTHTKPSIWGRVVKEISISFDLIDFDDDDERKEGKEEEEEEPAMENSGQKEDDGEKVEMERDGRKQVDEKQKAKKKEDAKTRDMTKQDTHTKVGRPTNGKKKAGTPNDNKKSNEQKAGSETVQVATDNTSALHLFQKASSMR